MEENKENTNIDISSNNTGENKIKKSTITIAQAIIIAGFFIMIGIVVSNGSYKKNTNTNSLSEKVGIAQEKLFSCIADTDLDTLDKNITDSVANAMSNIPEKERGTPYTVIVVDGKPISEIRGASSVSTLSSMIAEASTGKSSKPYTGNIVISEATDHIYGSKDAKIKLIEYSDYECPYCKQFYPIVKKTIDESNGNIALVYRHYPIHQHSFEKLVAANCVDQLKGNDSFWKYSGMLFDLLKTGNESISEQL